MQELEKSFWQAIWRYGREDLEQSSTRKYSQLGSTSYSDSGGTFAPRQASLSTSTAVNAGPHKLEQKKPTWPNWILKSSVTS